jgi:hypothetical protein
MYADMAKAWTNIALVEADVLRLARRESHYKRLKTGASFLSQRNALHAVAHVGSSDRVIRRDVDTFVAGATPKNVQRHEAFAQALARGKNATAPPAQNVHNAGPLLLPDFIPAFLKVASA